MEAYKLKIKKASLEKTTKIYIAGHKGMVGSAVWRVLVSKGYSNLIGKTSKEVLSVDPSYFRPTEVDLLIGGPTKAKEKLGWVPEHDLGSLVKDMMQSDVKLMQKDQYLKKGGNSANNYYE